MNRQLLQCGSYMVVSKYVAMLVSNVVTTLRYSTAKYVRWQMSDDSRKLLFNCYETFGTHRQRAIATVGHICELCENAWTDRDAVVGSGSSRCSTKTAKHRITQTKPHDSPGTLFFWRQILAKFYRGLTAGAPNAGGIG